MLQQEEMNDGETSIAGPIFVSIGDEEKLNIFLDKNPYVPRNMAFVDDYDFAAYQTAGFGRFDEQDKEVAKEATKAMVAPDLGGVGGWWNYMTSVGKISPIPKGMKLGEIPEGVLRLGGTFVIDGNQIVYRWSDRLPGDHPDIEQVLQIAKEAAAKKQSNPISEIATFFGL
jgi:hypothetical protein